MTISETQAVDRVREHTAPAVNAKIDRATTAALQQTGFGGQHGIRERLKALDGEWDVDRALMANFAILGIVTHELGRRVHPAWTMVFRAQLAFMLMHAVVGWCPPLPVFRRLGFRTAKEIAAERATIFERAKASRGPT
jgi:hypothetical protein